MYGMDNRTRFMPGSVMDFSPTELLMIRILLKNEMPGTAGPV
jgi:hypothetical protein